MIKVILIRNLCKDLNCELPATVRVKVEGDPGFDTTGETYCRDHAVDRMNDLADYYKRHGKVETDTTLA